MIETDRACCIAGVWIAKPALYLGPAQMLEVQFLKNSKCHDPGEGGLIACLQEIPERGNAIWLVGDSHAGNFTVALQSAAETLGVGFQYLTGRSLPLSLSNGCAGSLCPEGSFAELAVRLKTVSIPGDVVIISFSRDRFLSDADGDDSFRKNLADLVDDLKTTQLKVVLVEDIPKVCNDDGDYVRSAFMRETCSVSAAQSRHERSVLSAILSRH